MYRFEKLEVWKEAIEYGKKGYNITNTLPKEEQFGLMSQLKRAFVSISSNIAEGSGSSTVKGFSNYLDIAIKSTLETVSQLLFAKELGYLEDSSVRPLYEEAEVLVKKIQSLKKYLKNSNHE